MGLFGAPILVIDSETSAWPGTKWARLLEIGAVLLDVDGNETDAFSSLIRPDWLPAMADAALKVTGLTRAELHTAPPHWDVREEFHSWLSATGVHYATSYNVAFDRRALALVEGFWPERIKWARCIHRAAKPILTAAGKKSKLADAAAHFGVRVDGRAHRALSDARVAAGIACAVRRWELDHPVQEPEERQLMLVGK